MSRFNAEKFVADRLGSVSRLCTSRVYDLLNSTADRNQMNAVARYIKANSPEGLKAEFALEVKECLRDIRG